MSLLGSRDQTLGPALEKGRFLTEHGSLKDVVSSKPMPSNLGQSGQLRKLGSRQSFSLQTNHLAESPKSFTVTGVLTKKGREANREKGFLKNALERYNVNKILQTQCWVEGSRSTEHTTLWVYTCKFKNRQTHNIILGSMWLYYKEEEANDKMKDRSYPDKVAIWEEHMGRVGFLECWSSLFISVVATWVITFNYCLKCTYFIS